jgi:hypothetical protein
MMVKCQDIPHEWSQVWRFPNMAGGTPIADWFGMENLSKIGGFGATPMA